MIWTESFQQLRGPFRVDRKFEVITMHDENFVLPRFSFLNRLVSPTRLKATHTYCMQFDANANTRQSTMFTSQRSKKRLYE